MTETDVDPDRAAELRGQMVDALVADGTIISAQVEAVMRAVPRHRFAPDASLDEAYAPYKAVFTKKDAHGVITSSVSAPQIQAMMLEQAEVAQLLPDGAGEAPGPVRLFSDGDNLVQGKPVHGLAEQREGLAQVEVQAFHMRLLEWFHAE